MSQPKIAIIGANGMLASMIRKMAPKSTDLHLFDLPDFDMTDTQNVESVMGTLQPEIIINCAAFTQVDKCETEQQLAHAANGTGAGNLAIAAKNTGATLIHISTDFVFFGDKDTPYSETDQPEPLSVYGASKLAGERAIINSGLSNYYILRTSWLYGPGGGNFVETIIRLANEREDLGIVADQVGTPTYTTDLANVIWTLVSSVTDHPSFVTAPYGIYHYSNSGECSWYEFACEIISQLREANVPLKVKQIRPITTAEYPVPAKRPTYSVMSKEKIVAATGIEVPPWQESLKKYLKGRIKN